MPSLEARLVAGLEAQDWRETFARGPWRRFGKFGRGAMYVVDQPGFHRGVHLWEGLWFSDLHVTQPNVAVTGPILEQVLAAGDKALGSQRPDTEDMLCELMYFKGDKQ